MSGATFVGMPKFPVAAHEALGNAQLRHNLAHATGTIRAKRQRLVDEVDENSDWEELRLAGAGVKESALRDLGNQLELLEASLTANGATVHWARDAAEANAIVASIAKAHGVDEVVKVKSMVTQEIGLNEALEAEGIAAWETDLAELIVQLGDDLPSHILVPAIHRNRAEIREIFLAKMGTVGGLRPTTSPTSRPCSRPRPGRTCARSSCAPRSASRAPTSPSPRPAPWSSSSPRATAGCA